MAGGLHEPSMDCALTVMARQHPDIGLVAQHPMPRGRHGREHAIYQTGPPHRRPIRGGLIACCCNRRCRLAGVGPCVARAEEEEEEHEGGGGLEERQREWSGGCVCVCVFVLMAMGIEPKAKRSQPNPGTAQPYRDIPDRRRCPYAHAMPAVPVLLWTCGVYVCRNRIMLALREACVGSDIRQRPTD